MSVSFRFALMDESFGVLAVDYCRAAATMDLHKTGQQIIKVICCHVPSHNELQGFTKTGTDQRS